MKYEVPLIFLAIGLSITSLVLEYENKKLDEELAKPIEPVDYLVPGPKPAVEQVINNYYVEHPIVIDKVKISSPTVKKTAKTTKKTTKQKTIQKKTTYINIYDMKVIDEIAIYIKTKEGFSSKAYKDNTQYSNGYGTKATSKYEVITKKEANIRLYKHIKRTILPSFKDIKFKSIEQVYSAVDFSYNLGHNRFRKNIVNENGELDCYKMMSYNKMRDKKGRLVYSEGLAQRRFENFISCSSYDF